MKHAKIKTAKNFCIIIRYSNMLTIPFSRGHVHIQTVTTSQAIMSDRSHFPFSGF